MKDPKRILRELFRFYLRNFPLRDGKVMLYDSLNKILTPAERNVELEIKSGFKLCLDLNESAQRKIYFFGNYDERHEIAMLRKIIAPGDAFWDVGANIGFYTLTASGLVGGNGSVYAFEPGAGSWNSLIANLAINKRVNIYPFKLAVSDNYGSVTLYSKTGMADGEASLIFRGGDDCRPESIPSVSLDGFRQEHGLQSPSFIKVDVEGTEARVLSGARRILSGNSPPILLVEMNDKVAVGRFLEDMGFRGVYLRRGRWYMCKDIGAVQSRNMLWFRPDCAGHNERIRNIPVKTD